VFHLKDGATQSHQGEEQGAKSRYHENFITFANQEGKKLGFAIENVIEQGHILGFSEI